MRLQNYFRINQGIVLFEGWLCNNSYIMKGSPEEQTQQEIQLSSLSLSIYKQGDFKKLTYTIVGARKSEIHRGGQQARNTGKS